MTMTQPNIAFALSIVSKYYNNPNSTYVAVVTEILYYIKGTLDEGMVFYGKQNVLDHTRYTDAYYGPAKDNRKSTNRWLFCLGGGPIS